MVDEHRGDEPDEKHDVWDQVLKRLRMPEERELDFQSDDADEHQCEYELAQR